MAFKARVITKSDTLANYETSGLTYQKGEMLYIKANSPSIKIGNGSDNFHDLKYAIAPITDAELDVICGMTTTNAILGVSKLGEIIL